MKSAGDSPGGGGAESGGAVRGKGGSVKVTRDSEGNTVFSKQKGSESGKNESEGKKEVYGKPGNIKCVVCKSFRDHYAAQCPGFICYNCKGQGHFAVDCKKTLRRFCGKLDHGLEGCTLGGSSYRDIAAGIKRRVEESNNRGPDSKLKKPSSSLAFVAKMDSFVEEMESESVSTEAAIEQRKAMLLHRRRQVEEQYKRALSAIEKDERELEEEIESEKEYREALLHLAAVKQKRAQRRGARSASSVTTTRKESKVEESKEEIQPETSVVKVVPSRDASCEERRLRNPKRRSNLKAPKRVAMTTSLLVLSQKFIVATTTSLLVLSQKFRVAMTTSLLVLSQKFQITWWQWRRNMRRPIGMGILPVWRKVIC